jgi:hypothetical protein
VGAMQPPQEQNLRRWVVPKVGSERELEVAKSEEKSDVHIVEGGTASLVYGMTKSLL